MLISRQTHRRHAGFRESPSLRIPAIALCALGLAACASASGGLTPEEVSTAWSVVYVCEGGSSFSARITDDYAMVTVDGRRIEMEPAPDGRPGVFAGEGFTLTSGGNDVGLLGPSEARTSCDLRPASSPWEDAAHRGVTFRGIGQEPGWYVEIVPGQSLLYVGMYGEDRILAGAPVETPDAAHARTEFRATAGEGAVVLVVVETHCVDVMSGEGFPARASLAVDGASHHGCGRWLSP